MYVYIQAGIAADRHEKRPERQAERGDELDEKVLDSVNLAGALCLDDDALGDDFVAIGTSERLAHELSVNVRSDVDEQRVALEHALPVHLHDEVMQSLAFLAHVASPQSLSAPRAEVDELVVERCQVV